MKKIILFLFIFVSTFLIIDLILSFFFPKEIYSYITNKIEIVPKEVSKKQMTGLDTYNIGNIPYWEAHYRGPYFNYEKIKKLNCRILGIGDSIMWGSGVGDKDYYLYLLSENLKNTEIINHAVPGFDTLQQIVKFKKEDLGANTDLLIWHVWGDDKNIYKLVKGVLYDSNIVLNGDGKPYLSFVPEKLNNFLIKYSYIYNKILKLKMKGEIKKDSILSEEFLGDELEKVFNEYLSFGEDKKILLLFSPSLENNSYKKSGLENNTLNKGGYPYYYNVLDEKFSSNKKINIVYLDKFFNGIEVSRIRYDECCHFNEKGHKIISEELYKYIKLNKFLDEKCF